MKERYPEKGTCTIVEALHHALDGWTVRHLDWTRPVSITWNVHSFKWNPDDPLVGEPLALYGYFCEREVEMAKPENVCVRCKGRQVEKVGRLCPICLAAVINEEAKQRTCPVVLAPNQEFWPVIDETASNNRPCRLRGSDGNAWKKRTVADLQGFVAFVWRGGKGSFIASCPGWGSKIGDFLGAIMEKKGIHNET